MNEAEIHYPNKCFENKIKLRSSTMAKTSAYRKKGKKLKMWDRMMKNERVSSPNLKQKVVEREDYKVKEGLTRAKIYKKKSLGGTIVGFECIERKILVTR